MIELNDFTAAEDEGRSVESGLIEGVAAAFSDFACEGNSAATDEC